MESPITTIPEELLERIIALALLSSSCDTSLPSLLPLKVSRVSPLLVCKLWLRIGTPLYYRSVALTTSQQTTQFASTLKTEPHLGRYVKEMKVEGIFPQVNDVMKCLGEARCSPTSKSSCHDHSGMDLTQMGSVSLRKLDVQLDGSMSLPDVEVFCDALDYVANVHHFILRKPPSVYLTQPGVMLAMKHIAEGFERWSSLVSGFP